MIINPRDLFLFLSFFPKPLFQAIVEPNAPVSHENSRRSDYVFKSPFSRILRRISAIIFEMTMTLHLPRVDLWRVSATVPHCNERYKKKTKNVRMTVMYIRHFYIHSFQSKQQKCLLKGASTIFFLLSFKIAMAYSIKSCIIQ